MNNLKQLRGFAQDMFDLADWPDGGDIGGFDFQDVAVTWGLLVETKPDAPCGDNCRCVDYYSTEDFKNKHVICYRKTSILTGRNEAR